MASIGDTLHEIFSTQKTNRLDAGAIAEIVVGRHPNCSDRWRDDRAARTVESMRRAYNRGVFGQMTRTVPTMQRPENPIRAYVDGKMVPVHAPKTVAVKS